MPAPIWHRVLLTNDDGLDAPGLKVLERVAQTLAREVWVVAPARDQSGVATCLSLHQPLRIEQAGERRWTVSGTPADAVTVALRHLMQDIVPDMVLSGINRGANLGAETLYSGTLGAALTATRLGVPAIALSQAFTDNVAVPWATAKALAPSALATLAEAGTDPAVVLNLNFPDVPAEAAKSLVVCCQGEGAMQDIDVIEGTDPRQKAYYWLKIKRSVEEDAPLSETHCLGEGHITVSPIGIERTDGITFKKLEQYLSTS